MVSSTTRRGLLRAMGGAAALGSLAGCVGAAGSPGGDSVRFGVLLPLSGPLKGIGEHGKRAAEEAVADVNDAGGILGRPVELLAVDSESDPTVARDGYRSLVDEGIVGFVGDLVSDVSLALAPQAASDAVMMVSPASTNPRLTDMGRRGGRKYFARTVPSDILQALVMAKILDSPEYVDAGTVAILTIDNAFGVDLSAEVAANLDADTVATVKYDPTAASFDGVIDSVFAEGPDAVAFVSVPGNERGVLDAYAATDHDVPWVFSAGMFGGELPSYYEGFYSASLSAVRTRGFFSLSQRLSDIAPLAPYAANAYDALFLMAAAAEMAGEASGSAIAGAIQSVSGGAGHAVSVGDFDSVRLLADAGREMNYQGAASGVDLTDALEPVSSYLVERVENGSVTQLELLQRQFFEAGGGR